MLTFQRAFGLLDNPFRPQNLDVTAVAVAQNLHTEALRIHEEAGLLDLFVAEAGPFREHLGAFVDLMEAEDYGPRHLGKQSFTFLVCGPKGSGKSTFVSRMIHWLKDCQNGSRLAVVESASLVGPGVVAEAPTCGQLVGAVVERLQTSGQAGDVSCVVIEDLKAACETEVLKLFTSLTHKRTVVMFLVSDDLAVFDHRLDDARVEVHRFPTTPLTPEQAEAFVSGRIARFRDSAMLDVLRDQPLFPFDAADIRQAVAEKGASANVAGAIVLRGLSLNLNHALRNARIELHRRAPTFDLATVPADELGEHLIRVSGSRTVLEGLK